MRKEEEAARRAEEAGGRLLAFRQYAVAYALAPEGEAEDRLADALVRVWKGANPKPGYPTALAGYLAQAQAHASAGRHEEAAVLYRHATRFCPWCAEAHYNLALILGEYRKYPEAVRALRRAQALLPEGPESDEIEGTLIAWELIGP